MKKLTNLDRLEQLFMHSPMEETRELLSRAALIVKIREAQNGTQPAKRPYVRKKKNS